MLQELDQVAWNTLEHAYGIAFDVPDLLRRLAGPDHRLALEQLYGTIWHQGTVYSATAPCVPFLLELAELPAVPERRSLLSLLADLATGGSYADVHGGPEDQRQIELGWVRQARAAVGAGTPVYLRLLADPEADLREAAAYLLGSLEPDPETVGEIRRRLDAERDPRVRCSLALALGGAVPGAEPCVKLATLQAVGPEDLDWVVEALCGEGDHSVFESTTWADGLSAAAWLCQRLARLSDDGAELALTRALERTPEPLSVLDALLDIAAARPERQSAILQALARSEAIWRQRSTPPVLRSHGLPAERGALLEAAYARRMGSPSADPSTSVGSQGA